MTSTLTRQICVANPHAGLLLPPEVAPEWLSAHFRDLVPLSNDFYTDALYNFSDLLGCAQIIFPYTPVVINANRNPKVLDHAVPLTVRGLPVYRPDCEPDANLRRELLRYHRAFHTRIACATKLFILDGHSTMDGDPDEDGSLVSEDIILDDTQQSEFDPPGGIRTAPAGYLDTYAEELTRRLPREIQVTRNSRYLNVYGHVMAQHGWDGSGPRGHRAPLILQETNERLYMQGGWPNVDALDGLRRIFAAALEATLEKMSRIYPIN